MSDTIELPAGTIEAVADAIRDEAASIGYVFGMSTVASAADLARAVDQQAATEAMNEIARAAVRETIRGLMAAGYLCRRPKGGV